MNCSHLLLLSFLSFCALSYGQYNFTPLECKGPTPDIIKKTFLETYEKEVEAHEHHHEEKRTYRKNKEELLLESTLEFVDLIKSGQVSYGDSITNYLNQIANKVLTKEPELRKKIQIFTYKSSIVNAFCTTEGYIFISLGLISRAENEAQLAFIIAHEAAHYYEDHVLKSLIDNIDLQKNKRARKRLTVSDIVDMQFKRSRTNELQADATGYRFYESAGYKPIHAYEETTKLGLAHLPVFAEDVERNILNTGNIHVPAAFFLDSLNEARGRFKADDRYKTHPNTNTRRKAIRALYSKQPQSGETTLVKHINFNQIRRLTCFELVNSLLFDRQYGEAFYTAQCLLKTYPENNYLQRCLIKALYGIAKYKNHNYLYAVSGSYSDSEGPQQQMNFLFKNLKPVQLTTIAASKLDEHLRKDSSESELFFRMRNDLIAELAIEHKLFKNQFHSLAQAKAYKQKIDKIDRSEPKVYQRRDLKNFHLSAFTDISQRKELSIIFDNAQKKYDQYMVKKDMPYKEKMKLKRETEKRKKEEGHRIYADNILMVNPSFTKQKNKLEKAVAASEDMGAKFTQGVKAALTAVTNKNIDFMAMSEMGSNPTSFFNNFSKGNLWLIERYGHIKTVKMIPLFDLETKYDYVCYLDVFNGIGSNNYYRFTLINSKTGKAKYYHYDGSVADFSIDRTLKRFNDDLDKILN